MALTDKIADFAQATGERFLLDGLFPGFILPWDGALGGSDGKRPIDSRTGKANENWALCDGTNGTPDLRGKFVRAAADGESAGTTGGAATETVDAAGWDYVMSTAEGEETKDVLLGTPEHIILYYVKKIA